MEHHAKYQMNMVIVTIFNQMFNLWFSFFLCISNIIPHMHHHFRFLSMSSTLKLRKRSFRCYRSSFFQHRNPLERRKYWTTVQKRSEFHNSSWRSNSVVFHLPLWWIQDTYLLMYNISVVQLCIPPTPSEKQWMNE